MAFGKLVILLLFSCSTNDPAPQVGCWTGTINGNRLPIACCTKSAYLAGSNEALGGIARAAGYKDWQFTPVTDCSKCH